jgi:hypothetical protein
MHGVAIAAIVKGVWHEVVPPSLPSMTANLMVGY